MFLIGVLVAISIPIFTSQLEKSREATDAANIRSAYAVVQSAALTQDSSTDFAKNNTSLATFTTTGSKATGDLTYKAVVTLKQSQTGWQTAPVDIAGKQIGADDGIATATIEWTQASNATTITLA